MTTTTQTKLLRQETIEQLDGTKTILSYFEPTDETMQALATDLFEHNWQRIVVGPCIQGAVFEVCFQQPPTLSYLDGYLTVNLGPWHFHLCVGTHTGTPSEELRRKRPVAKIAFFEERGRGCAGGRSWGLQMWNGFGEQMTTVFLPNPFLSDEQRSSENHSGSVCACGMSYAKNISASRCPRSVNPSMRRMRTRSCTVTMPRT